MDTRPIPSTGEALPVIGCGTWQGFDVADAETSDLTEVLRNLFESSGSVVDSSPMPWLVEPLEPFLFWIRPPVQVGIA